MSPDEVIGKFMSFELMIKGSKKIIEQGASSVPEAQPVAFKATEEKKKDSTHQFFVFWPYNRNKITFRP
jgi:hypothetical protein